VNARDVRALYSYIRKEIRSLIYNLMALLRCTAEKKHDINDIMRGETTCLSHNCKCTRAQIGMHVRIYHLTRARALSREI